MSSKRQKISCIEANETDLVNYLESIGYLPAKVRNNDYWYSSPLRKERTPSFKVNRKINRWYDHGISEGGTLIDLLMRLQHCDVSEALRIVEENAFINLTVHQPERHVQEEAMKLEVIAVKPLRHPALLNYLKGRAIDPEQAKKYCREVTYRFDRQSYFGIGFPNNSGGYEIRNPFYKYSSAPKDITVISGAGDTLVVFEGFMDFLSFLSSPNEMKSSCSFLVLNGIGFFERARGVMEVYPKIDLYLDRDKAGLEATAKALQISKAYHDKSRLYDGFKDLNEWAIASQKKQIIKPKHKLGR